MRLVVDFPLLGRDLVEFAASKFEEATGCTRALQVDVGVRVLEQLKHRPEPFLKAVMVMLASPGMSFEQAAESVVKANSEQEDYDGTWRNLSELQRQLLLLSLQPDFHSFARATFQNIAQRLGLGKGMLSTVQSAMRSLDDRSILSKSPRGSYEFEDHLFMRWVKSTALHRGSSTGGD